MKTTCRSMTQPQGTAHAEHALTQLAARFEDWRHSRTSSSDPIPQPLWEQAVSLTTVLSISRVAQGIGVSWGTLKKRCTAHPFPVWLKISAVSTPVKWLRLGVYWTARSRHGLHPEEGL